MRIAESYIYLREVRFHACHGVMPQEQRVGADFTVTLRAAVDLSGSVASDDLTDTVNYAELYEVVKREMLIPSKLLEHVAGRIGHAALDRFPQIRQLEVSVTKVNPPMGADCQGAGVALSITRE